MKFRGLALSILLTGVLTSCGAKKMNSGPITLRYNDNGLIVAAMVDPAPISQNENEYVPGERLMQSQWGQSAPFNEALPRIENRLPLIGCVNTAMAQVMKYYQFPAKGQGVVIGKLANQDVWADLNSTINWKAIPVNHREAKEDYQRAEVADLLKNMAVINRTTLGIDGSSTVTADMVQNLIQFYGYKNSIRSIGSSVENYNTAIEESVIAEINNKRPVFLSMTGTLNHLVIIDGYKFDNDEVLFHLNMGWEGMNDGFYSLKEPVQLIEEFEQNGSRWQRTLEADTYTAYIGIEPCLDEACYNNLEIDDKIENGKTMSGNIDFLSDVDTFGPFPPSAAAQINISGWSSVGYYITALDQYFRPLNEQNSNFAFTPTTPFYIRVSNSSMMTNRLYTSTRSYKFDLFSEAIEAEAINDTVFDLALTREQLILKPEENAIIRAQVIPFAPENSFLKVVDSEGRLVGEVEGNIIKILANNLNADGIQVLKVIAYNESDEKILAEKSVSIMIAENSISFGKEQTLTGSFPSRDGHVEFKAALQGECTIAGDRGFSNQAFYIKVGGYSAMDEAAQGTFEMGIYTIKASLSYDRRSYNFDSAHKDFTINISCPQADHSLETLAELP